MHRIQTGHHVFFRLLVVLVAGIIAVLLATPLQAMAQTELTPGRVSEGASSLETQASAVNATGKASMKKLLDVHVANDDYEPGWADENLLNTYRKYDVTGDGIADKLEIALLGYNKSTISGIKLMVNGESWGTIKSKYALYDMKLYLITLKNGQPFFYWPREAVFQYKNGAMKEILTRKSMFGGKGGFYGGSALLSVKPSGNSLIANYEGGTNVFGLTRVSLKYSYEKGTLKLASGKPSSWGYFGERFWKLFDKPKLKPIKVVCEATQDFKLYKTQSMKKVSYVVRKGQKVRASEGFVANGNLYAKVHCGGKSGWVKCQNVLFGSAKAKRTNVWFSNNYLQTYGI